MCFFLLLLDFIATNVNRPHDSVEVCIGLRHVLTRDRSLFKSLRVYWGAELAANTDHRLVIAVTSLCPFRASKQPQSARLDAVALKSNSNPAHCYNIAISNAFDALGELPDNVKDAWQSVRRTIVSTAKATLPKQTTRRRPWLSPDTLEVLEKKRDVRLAEQSEKYRQLKGKGKSRPGGILQHIGWWGAGRLAAEWLTSCLPGKSSECVVEVNELR